MIESKLDGQVVEKYPYIGISENNCVVLFVKRNTGTCLILGDDNGNTHGHGTYNVGDYCTDWAEDIFKPLDRKVELSNK